MDENIQDMSAPGQVLRATDPVVSNVATPGDFSAQWATPLDATEILAMAEEVSLYRAIPVLTTNLKEETWREMTALAFTSGSSYVSFQDGSCPEEYYHDGSNTTVSLKAQGVKKSLTISDIMHSMGVAALPMGGINNMVGAVSAFEGLPGEGGVDANTLGRIRDMKAQEIVLGTILLLNGQDRLLAAGNSNSNALEYDGIERTLRTGGGVFEPASQTGTFVALSYDRFLAESNVRPTTLVAHPTVLQEVQAGYNQLGFNGSTQIVYTDGNRIVPGYNFASSVNTAVGTLSLLADLNMTRTAIGSTGTFQAPVYGLRMSHNGVPLVYRRVQIPLSYKDLAPGCTSVSFIVWEKSALIIKHKVAHSRYSAIFTGRVVASVPVVGA